MPSIQAYEGCLHPFAAAVYVLPVASPTGIDDPSIGTAKNGRKTKEHYRHFTEQTPKRLIQVA